MQWRANFKQVPLFSIHDMIKLKFSTNKERFLKGLNDNN
jgi:hypothetical protein